MRSAFLLGIILVSFSASAAEQQRQIVPVLPNQLVETFNSEGACNDALYSRLYQSRDDMKTRGFFVTDPVIATPYMGFLKYTKNAKDTLLTMYCNDEDMYASIITQL